ncbi:unnamed protein product [Gordionus sp. m RMFG-2023]
MYLIKRVKNICKPLSCIIIFLYVFIWYYPIRIAIYPPKFINVPRIFSRYHFQLEINDISRHQNGKVNLIVNKNYDQYSNTLIGSVINSYTYLKLSRAYPDYHQNIEASCKCAVGKCYDFASDCLLDPIIPITFNFHRDILAFVHIQKTGGTEFTSILAHNVQVDPECLCRPKMIQNVQVEKCICERPNTKSLKNTINNESAYITEGWLYSRLTYGWIYCGLHPIYVRLRDCLPMAMKLRSLSTTGNNYYQQFIAENDIKIDSKILYPKKGYERKLTQDPLYVRFFFYF